jgi:hypothetical protein
MPNQHAGTIEYEKCGDGKQMRGEVAIKRQ